jgi:hypothetical protein
MKDFNGLKNLLIKIINFGTKFGFQTSLNYTVKYKVEC